MKVKLEKTIKAGIREVWAAFDNPDNMVHWQPTLESWNHKHGQPGHPDSVAELVYNENGRIVTVTETVTERREPDFLAGTYESSWGKTLIVNHFSAIDDSNTQWVMYSNMAFKGFMKLLTIFVGGSIRKRNEADMDRFVQFVETGTASQT